MSLFLAVFAFCVNLNWQNYSILSLFWQKLHAKIFLNTHVRNSSQRHHIRPLYRLFFTPVTAFGRDKISTQKIKKQFFQRKILFFKDALFFNAHYFTVLIYLATWRAAKLGIFTHFMFINLPWCSINSLMYAYYTDPQLLFTSAWSQSWLHFFVLHPPPQKKFCIIPSKLTLSDVSEVFIILQYPNLAIHLMQRGTSPTVLKAWLNISPPMEASI